MRIPVLVSCVVVVVAGCGAPDNLGEARPLSTSQDVTTTIATTTTTSAPAVATSSTSLPGSTTTVLANTTTIVPTISRPPIRLDLPAGDVVRQITFLGDSILADLREMFDLGPDRTNNIVIDVGAALRSHDELAGVEVSNLARPGLSIRYPFEPIATEHPEFRTLRVACETYFAGLSAADRPDLVVVATSAIDLNAKRDLPATKVAPEVVRELGLVVDYLDSLGIATVILPASEVNDEMYGELVGTHVALNERVVLLNDLLAESDLPMLFARFEGFDSDDIPGPDTEYFVDFSDGWPSDGIHLNQVGRAVFVDNVAPALEELLLSSL